MTSLESNGDKKKKERRACAVRRARKVGGGDDEEGTRGLPDQARGAGADGMTDKGFWGHACQASPGPHLEGGSERYSPDAARYKVSGT